MTSAATVTLTTLNQHALQTCRNFAATTTTPELLSLLYHTSLSKAFYWNLGIVH